MAATICIQDGDLLVDIFSGRFRDGIDYVGDSKLSKYESSTNQSRSKFKGGINNVFPAGK